MKSKKQDEVKVINFKIRKYAHTLLKKHAASNCVTIPEMLESMILLYDETETPGAQKTQKSAHTGR